MKKRLIALLLVAVMMVAMAAPALAKEPTVKKVKYEGGKKVEVSFKGRVSYSKPKVTVKSSNGKTLSAKITDKDKDDIEFSVSGLEAGGKYSFTISGVRAGTSGSYGKVTGSFTVPAKAAKLSIKKVKYDSKDKELDIDFNGEVKYKSVKVVVKDSSGKKYTTRITDKGNDDLEVKVSGLKKGKSYKVTVSGVALKGGSYTSVSKSFTAK